MAFRRRPFREEPGEADGADRTPAPHEPKPSQLALEAVQAQWRRKETDRWPSRASECGRIVANSWAGTTARKVSLPVNPVRVVNLPAVRSAPPAVDRGRHRSEDDSAGAPTRGTIAACPRRSWAADRRADRPPPGLALPGQLPSCGPTLQSHSRIVAGFSDRSTGARRGRRLCLLDATVDLG